MKCLIIKLLRIKLKRRKVLSHCLSSVINIQINLRQRTLGDIVAQFQSYPIIQKMLIFQIQGVTIHVDQSDRKVEKVEADQIEILWLQFLELLN